MKTLHKTVIHLAKFPNKFPFPTFFVLAAANSSSALQSLTVDMVRAKNREKFLLIVMISYYIDIKWK